jgi:predicted GNAT family acetyltransferase
MIQTLSPTYNSSRTLRVSPKMNRVEVERLNNRNEREVLEFLSQRPIHTVAMVGFIRDNGIVSALNRGTFYGCRDINGQLEGVALVGHATLMETVSDRALQALAQVAQECPYTHMIMGEQDRVADFWSHYADTGHRRRLACREWLFELRNPIQNVDKPSGLKLAAKEDLELVMPIQAALAYEESGINPMKLDPKGFRTRCLRRIEQGRTWVVVEDGVLVFKADVISQSADVVYLEGVWIKEDRRRSGAAVTFMSELTQALLENAKSICLLVNETNKRAHNFYQKCGFLFRATYETIFLPQKEQFSN